MPKRKRKQRLRDIEMEMQEILERANQKSTVYEAKDAELFKIDDTEDKFAGLSKKKRRIAQREKGTKVFKKEVSEAPEGSNSYKMVDKILAMTATANSEGQGGVDIKSGGAFGSKSTVYMSEAKVRRILEASKPRAGTKKMRRDRQRGKQQADNGGAGAFDPEAEEFNTDALEYKAPTQALGETPMTRAIMREEPLGPYQGEQARKRGMPDAQDPELNLWGAEGVAANGAAPPSLPGAASSTSSSSSSSSSAVAAAGTAVSSSSSSSASDAERRRKQHEIMVTIEKKAGVVKPVGASRKWKRAGAREEDEAARSETSRPLPRGLPAEAPKERATLTATTLPGRAESYNPEKEQYQDELHAAAAAALEKRRKRAERQAALRGDEANTRLGLSPAAPSGLDILRQKWRRKEFLEKKRDGKGKGKGKGAAEEEDLLGLEEAFSDWSDEDEDTTRAAWEEQRRAAGARRVSAEDRKTKTQRNKEKRHREMLELHAKQRAEKESKAKEAKRNSKRAKQLEKEEAAKKEAARQEKLAERKAAAMEAKPVPLRAGKKAPMSNAETMLRPALALGDELAGEMRRMAVVRQQHPAKEMFNSLWARDKIELGKEDGGRMRQKRLNLRRKRVKRR